ncbi:MAG: non-hydrolyzing UDP-N-acetylglucosamine 2-epimerase [Flavobacteriaceae bacterium]
MKKKILTIVGARPQFIKASVISRLINKTYNSEFEEILVNTGQHYDKNMSSIFFDDLKINKANYNLNLGSFSNISQVSKIMVMLEKIINYENPDLVLTYGDTNSTLAGSLAAAKTSIKLAHVEAGLRSNRYGMQEEINRIITDRISQFLFCPTNYAVENLKKEGIKKNVFNTGDIMLDSFNYVKSNFFSYDVLEKFNLKNKNYFFTTFHRAENVDDYERLKNIIETMNYLSNYKDIIFPIHPRTKKNLKKFKIKLSSKIIDVDPQSYPVVVNLISNCFAVITDSGGLQKESYFANKPCITLRDETEWEKTVKLGYNILFSPQNLISEKVNIINSINKMPNDFPSIFGEGNCGSKILEILKKLI